MGDHASLAFFDDLLVFLKERLFGFVGLAGSLHEVCVPLSGLLDALQVRVAAALCEELDNINTPLPVEL